MDNFEHFFSPWQWQILLKVAQIAQDHGLRAFAIGGIVRDALMAKAANSHHAVKKFPTDLDLVFDGAERAGITVAIALHDMFPEAKLQIHDKFQTAEILLQGVDQNFTMDLATARREIYAYAGANPVVEATTIEEDLGRRDFTINALAIQLDPLLGTKGEVLDRFGGVADLAQRQVRAIREGSFAEDPRRLFRAARFATRLDLAIAPDTYQEITVTTASGLHDAIGGTRLRSELVYTLAEPKAGEMFSLLQTLGALRCIHPDLHLPEDLDNSFSHQWRRSQHWLRRISRLENKACTPITLSNLGIELLLSYLPPQISTQLDLSLTPEQKNRQVKLAQLIGDLPSFCNGDQKISALTQNLQKFDTHTLILAAVQCPINSRKIIWKYLTHWQRIKSPLTGDDLAELGYAKGKQMGHLLQLLRAAKLDGEICRKEDAIAYLQVISL